MKVLVIAAQPGRAVAIADIPGAFLKEPIVEKVLVKLRKEISQLLLEIFPDKYGSVVRHDVKIVVRMLKAL